MFQLEAWLSGPSTATFRVVAPQNSYFAIGFGSTMYGADVILWQASGASSGALNLYSSGEVTPVVDSVQNLKTTFTQNSSHVVFTTLRNLTTGDSKDFVIPMVRSFSFAYQA